MNNLKVFCSFLSIIFSFLFDFVQTYEGCNPNDTECIIEAANGVYKKTVTGTQCGIKPSDPLFIAKTEGTILCTRYLITNSTLTGLKNCEIIDAKLDVITNKFEQTLRCPKLIHSYNFVSEGSIKEAEVDGVGYGILTTGVYEITIKGTYGRFISSKDQKPHLFIKTYSVNSRALGRLVLENVNEDAEKREEAKQAVDYLNEHWEILAKYFKSPALEEFMAIFMNNLNCCIKTLTIEEISGTEE